MRVDIEHLLVNQRVAFLVYTERLADCGEHFLAVPAASANSTTFAIPC